VWGVGGISENKVVVPWIVKVNGNTATELKLNEKYRDVWLGGVLHTENGHLWAIGGTNHHAPT
jgi:hypothetical protein